MRFIFVPFAAVALVIFTLSGHYAKEMPVKFSKVADCKKGSKGAFDFSGLKLSKDKETITGEVVTKKDVSNIKMSLTVYRIKSGEREDLNTVEMDYCKIPKKKPNYLFYEILEQGIGSSCPIKKGKRHVNAKSKTDKLDEEITFGSQIDFSDSSCLRIEVQPRK